MLDKIKDFLFQLFLFLIGCILSLLYGEPMPIRSSRKVAQQNVQVLIIGAGVSGIAIAKKLNDIGLTGYTILEQGAELGGTWYWNKVYLKSFQNQKNWNKTVFNLFSILELNVMWLLLPTASHGIIIQIGVEPFLEQMKYRLHFLKETLEPIKI